MAKLILDIPDGKYCWRFDGKGGPCTYFDNYAEDKCEIFGSLFGQRDAAGIVKCASCLARTIGDKPCLGTQLLT